MITDQDTIPFKALFAVNLNGLRKYIIENIYFIIDGEKKSSIEEPISLGDNKQKTEIWKVSEKCIMACGCSIYFYH